MAQSNSINPFLSNLTNFDARQAFGLERSAVESDDAPMGYAMVQTGPSVSSEECENLAARAVEVNVLWGTNVLHVVHLDPPRAYCLGERSAAGGACDYTMPEERLGATSVSVVTLINGEPCVVVPANATAKVMTKGPIQTPAAGTVIPLQLGTSVSLAFGDVTIQVSGVHPGRRTKKSFFGESDRSAAGFFALSAAIVATFVGAMAAFVPSMGLTDEEGLDNERIYAIQQYLDAAAERNKEAQEEQANPDTEQGGGERAEAAKNEAGKLGKQNAPVTNKRAAVEGPKDNPNPTLPREEALREARSIGMIGLLNSMNGDTKAPTSPWGDIASGTDPMSANGNMWGDELGESGGSGGLGLSGIGEGGGGYGTGIGVGGIGTCGGTICSGLEGGFGNSFGRTPGGYNPKGHGMRVGDTKVERGSLPAEVIQRIVRQNYGRFRMCYEQGLGKNPNLQGRVNVRFVIDRTGAVSQAQNGGSDLPDSGVVSCVVSQYYGLSFPAPQDGIVTVNYPIMFTPG
jgi:hypothetical protein